MIRCLLIAVLIINPRPAAISQTIMPYLYWTFDKQEAGGNNIAENVINIKCGHRVIKSISGNAIDLEDKNCLVVTKALRGKITNQFSIELLFKGDKLFFLSFAQQYVYIKFYYAGISFRTSVLTNGKVKTENFAIPLNGAGKNSYSYFTDGKWHHLVFTASTITGKKEVWVDGELLPRFSTTITKNVPFAFGSSDGFRNTDQVDEVAFYNTVLPQAMIQQHARSVRAGNHYTFNINQSGNRSPAMTQKKEEGIYDALEFAPGYPDYNVQAYDQLKAFPLPRYKSGVAMNRLVSWMDITYLHRELLHAGGKGFGKTDPQKAVLLSQEMAENWNYYVDMPLLRASTAATDKNYSDTKSLYGALVNFLNRNPQYSYSTILIQVQGKPVQAGFERKTSYVLAQDLPARYYIQDATGTPVIYNRRKWLSPLMPLDIIQKDGETSRFYLDQLLKYIGRPPAVINENGEYFGHIRPLALLEKDPRVLANFKRSGLSVSAYSGWFQHRLDSTYKATVMKGFDTGRSHFTFYNLSAMNPAYWPDYAQRRNLNRWNKGTVYSTPDFYPRSPDNWYAAKGPFNGYGPIAYGRLKEIALGDKLFSPYVSAGWSKEEQNVRPAQWLALLKAMVMLGADFFYVGYFNVTGAGGKWPNGAGPNDPRGYAYQVAVPSYAQAIGTYVREFITRGELLNPAASNDPQKQFRFKGNAENELILVRRLGKKYLIYGSIQPNSNIKGNVPDKKITQINLDGKLVSFLIRRQGSMYILDLSKNTPVFYQLDIWHEYTHPWYWSKDIEVEAELPESESYAGNIGFDAQNENAFDFSAGIAWFTFQSDSDRPVYVFRERSSDPCYVYLRARIRKGKEGVLVATVEGNEKNQGSVAVQGQVWKWYRMKAMNQDKPLLVRRSDNSTIEMMLRPGRSDGPVEVDKLVLSTKENYPD